MKTDQLISDSFIRRLDAAGKIPVTSQWRHVFVGQKGDIEDKSNNMTYKTLVQ